MRSDGASGPEAATVLEAATLLEAAALFVVGVRARGVARGADAADAAAFFDGRGDEAAAAERFAGILRYERLETKARRINAELEALTKQLRTNKIFERNATKG